MKKVSIACNIVVLMASLFMLYWISRLDLSLFSITSSEFRPINVSLFLASVPSLIKVHLSRLGIKENIMWLIIYICSLICWLYLLYLSISNTYFERVFSSILTANILIFIGVGFQLTMVKGKEND